MSKFYYQNKEGDIVVSKTGIPSKDDKALTETIIAEAKEKELIPSDGGSAIPGPQGPKGDKGDKGDTGPQGPAGQDGADAVLPSFKTINGETITGESDLKLQAVVHQPHMGSIIEFITTLDINLYKSWIDYARNEDDIYVIDDAGRRYTFFPGDEGYDAIIKVFDPTAGLYEESMYAGNSYYQLVVSLVTNPYIETAEGAEELQVLDAGYGPSYLPTANTVLKAADSHNIIDTLDSWNQSFWYNLAWYANVIDSGASSLPPLDGSFKDSFGRIYEYESVSENVLNVWVSVGNSYEVGGLYFSSEVSCEINAETSDMHVVVSELNTYDHNGDPYEEPNDNGEGSSEQVGPVDITLSELSEMLAYDPDEPLSELPSEGPTRGGNRSLEADEFAPGYKYNQEYRCICNGADFKQMWEELDAERAESIIGDTGGQGSVWSSFDGNVACYVMDHSPFMWINGFPVIRIGETCCAAYIGKTYEQKPSPYEELPAGSTNPVYDVVIFGVNIETDTENPQVVAFGTDQDILVKIIKYKVIDSSGSDEPNEPNEPIIK